jgi:hypothetical protein
VNVEEAREAAKKDKKAKVALLVGAETPLLDSKTTEVRLYATIGRAKAVLTRAARLRERLKGDKIAWGSANLEFYRFQSGFNMALDRKSPRKESSGTK